MDSRFKEWVYIEGLMQSAYHEAALKMNLSDSEFWILYVFNFHQEGCNQSVLYKEACLTKSTVNSAIRKMEQHQIEWVQHMNSLKAQAEELVMNELIYS